MQKLKYSLHPGVFLVLGVLMLGFFGAVRSIFEAGAASAPSQVTIPNSTPVVSQVVLNAGNSITLTGNTTTTVQVNFVVTDNNGCNDVFLRGSVLAVVYRSGISGGSSCATSTFGCYRMSTTTQSTCTANATTTLATSTFELYYFADATDSSSSYPAQDWVAYVSATDELGGNHTATSTHVELNTITSIDTSTSSVNYGQVNPNTNTGSTNQTVGVKNAGNSSTTLKLNAQQTLTLNQNTITTSSQHYATSSFTYGGSEQSLQDAATQVSGFLIQNPPSGRWATTTASPKALSSPIATDNNNFIYSIGGFADVSNTSTVRFTSTTANGALNSWINTTALPVSINSHDAVSYGSFIYSIGGNTTTVNFASVNSTGSLGSWATTTALSRDIARHKAAVYNDFLYVTGGSNSSEGGLATTTVSYVSINSTGSLGSWATTTPLPLAVENHGILAYNDFLYVFGGNNSGLEASYANVYYAPINSTGSIGSWRTGSTLPGASYSNLAVANNGIIYILGGYTPNPTSSIIFTPINSDGSLGAWTYAPYPMLIDPTDHGGVVLRGFAYSIGGFISGSTTSTVMYARLNSQDTLWGLAVPPGTATGSYAGTNVFSYVFEP